MIRHGSGLAHQSVHGDHGLVGCHAVGAATVDAHALPPAADPAARDDTPQQQAVRGSLFEAHHAAQLAVLAIQRLEGPQVMAQARDFVEHGLALAHGAACLEEEDKEVTAAIEHHAHDSLGRGSAIAYGSTQAQLRRDRQTDTNNYREQNQSAQHSIAAHVIPPRHAGSLLTHCGSTLKGTWSYQAVVRRRKFNSFSTTPVPSATALRGSSAK